MCKSTTEVQPFLHVTNSKCISVCRCYWEGSGRFTVSMQCVSGYVQKLVQFGQASNRGIKGSVHCTIETEFVKHRCM